MSSPIQNLDHLKIPLEDIFAATNEFSDENFIRQGGFGKIYNGKLKRYGESVDIVARRLDAKHEQGSQQFMTEILMLSKLEHENLVSLVGFCDEKNEKIVINKYEAKGSLDNYITDPSITWGKRLHICVGIVHALSYLYYDEKRDFSVVHGNIKSSKILLDYFWVPKLSGFEHSTMTTASRRDLHPTYLKTGSVTHKSDIYSLGVVLFEVFLGKKAIPDDSKLAELDDLINPDLRKQMNEESLKIFSETAYACLNEDHERRPDINQVVLKLRIAVDYQRKHANRALNLHRVEDRMLEKQELEKMSSHPLKELNTMIFSIQNLDHLKISLEDILEATDQFSKENFIKQGGFGKIYKGKLKRSGKLIDVVARRLDTMHGQGSKQFWTEILMLSKLEHKNVVSLIGFCDEKNVKIVVNKYEAKGSLDSYLSDPTITWQKRLHICVGIAHALSYIYYDEKRDFSVIHRNIKSSKILLDKFWAPKLSGFELSMTTLASQRHRLCIDDACGSTGYVDPTYVTKGSVTFKSDIYSFGVVLFEVLLGKKAITDNRDTKLAQLAKSHYEKRQLDDLIDPDLRKQMNQESFDIFSEAAYNCLKEQRAERPNIDQTISRLEKALELQLKYENPILKKDPAVVAAALDSTSNSYFRWKGLEHLRISFSDVESAKDKCRIRSVPNSFIVYKAQLEIFDSKNYLEIKGKCKSTELPKKMSTVYMKRFIGHSLFYKEIIALSTYTHPNIVSVHGICEEPTEKIIVYDDVTNGCLADYLGSDRNIDSFTWVRRIRICIDVAHGLAYIHSKHENNETKSQHIIISSSSVLLKDNWEAMIGGFSEDEHLESFYGGGDRKEKNIYCLGIILFEILCWRFASDPIFQQRNDTGLASFVQRCFRNGTRDEILDIKLKEEAEETIFNKGYDKISLDTFSNIAYQCVGDFHFQRPTIDQVIKELEKALHFQENRSKDNLKISLDKILLATLNFNCNKRIGKGGFGQVYKGEFTYPHGCEHIAAKRLDKKSDQGITELMTEFQILSNYKHENIVGLVGYCDEKDEKVIVYEYACGGSLDSWLKYDGLTWRKRLEICIDVANGLAFLHGSSETKKEVVIHRDMKSANVLLFGDGQAKISDFGLSLISPINQEMNYVIDNAKGTPGYCDPLYISTQFFTKESDIYSFGVLLFEMLCGRFVMEDKNSKAQNLVQLVRHHYKEGSLYEIVFEATKKQMALISLTKFQNIAFQCIHEERTKRPTADNVLIQLKKALEFQEKMDRLNISLEDVMLATQHFSNDNLIGKGDFWSIFKGHVRCANGCEIIAVKRLDRWSDQRKTERMAELEILLEYTHENIISLVGHCNEKGEKIMVYAYASISKGSLDRWLKYDGLTWRKRLEICIDIARGLTFLHETSDVKEEVVIHGDIKSENVLLNDDWKAKIDDFGQSLIRPIYHKTIHVVNNSIGTPGYCDPLNIATGVLTTESDIYSFGVLLFEMLCGRFVMEHNSSKTQSLVHLVRDHFEKGTLYEIVFEAIKKQMSPKSLNTFLKIAYQCLHEERSKRPTTNDVLIQLEKSLELQANIEHINISLDDIMLATQDFSLDNLIGKGGSGPVYKGQVTFAQGCKIIAAKRLDTISDQQEIERVTELEVLLEYKHKNIISLLGHCNEKRENIMVYEYASKGSLDRWLKYDGLTWRKRLEICIDIATGLTFLHGTNGANKEMVIHRDIKSKNVLLNGDWKAKIASFGCSLIIPVNQEMKYVVSNAKGTPGYCDPLYTTTGVLTKESDVYSFGVLLFEMLCGRHVMEDNSSEAQNLVHLVKRHFEEGKFSEMVFEAARKQIVPESLAAFQNIAYKCIVEERAKRPTASDVLIQLNKALEFQEEIEIWEPKLPKDLRNIIQMTYPPEIDNDMSNKNICRSLDLGFLLREKNVWFSLETNGRRVVVISATEFHFKSYFGPDKWIDSAWLCGLNSRFSRVAWISDSSKMNIRIKITAPLLLSGINYGVNLLFKFVGPIQNTDTCVGLKYRIGNKFLHSHSTTERDDTWLTKELFQFPSLAEEANIDVFLLGLSESHFKNQAIYIEGIEFLAINNMTHEEMEGLKRVSMPNVQQSLTNEGHWKVNMDEVEELPADEDGHVGRILNWLFE